MLSHISLGVSDLERSIVFYDAVLATLGYVRVWRDADAAGYGPPVATTNLRSSITKVYCKDQATEVTSHLTQVKTMLPDTSMLPPSFTEPTMREHLDIVRSTERGISRRLFEISTAIG